MSKFIQEEESGVKLRRHASEPTLFTACSVEGQKDKCYHKRQKEGDMKSRGGGNCLE